MGGRSRELIEIGMTLNLHFLEQEAELTLANTLFKHGEVGPQERRRREHGVAPLLLKPLSSKNPQTCKLHHGEVRGPFKLCATLCDVYQACLEWAKAGYSYHKRKDRKRFASKSFNETAQSQRCPYCNKAIARETTPRHSFLGLLTMHVKAKHFDQYRSGHFAEWKEEFKRG